MYRFNYTNLSIDAGLFLLFIFRFTQKERILLISQKVNSKWLPFKPTIEFLNFIFAQKQFIIWEKTISKWLVKCNEPKTTVSHSRHHQKSWAFKDKRTQKPISRDNNRSLFLPGRRLFSPFVFLPSAVRTAKMKVGAPKGFFGVFHSTPLIYPPIKRFAPKVKETSSLLFHFFFHLCGKTWKQLLCESTVK